MDKFKISASYWGKLNDVEKSFFQSNVGEYGINELKSVLSTLKKLHIVFDCIAPASYYIKDESKKLLSRNNWIIFLNEKIQYQLYCNTSNIGMQKKLYKMVDGKLTPIWNDITKYN